ncbi:MAG: RNA polymerase factor sigma-54 [Bacteroidales bacterium]|jgi:RNA polymerase sigma-54 factor|nr:RNA polymerase factor sigma-54 [Bacteroidales bacterium]
MQQLRLQQKLLQKLSPQQILLMKLLQIPSIGLDQRIKQEIEENPALEDDTPDKDEEPLPDNDDTKDDDDEYDITDYVDEDDIPEYKTRSNNYAEDDKKTIPFASAISFHELLMDQISHQGFTDKQIEIAKIIIGNIDDSGYLERDLESMVDDLVFTKNIDVTSEEIETVLSVVHTFDPIGVGARNLQECLHIQLRRKDTEDENVALAIRIIDRYFDAFTKKHYDKIIKKAQIEEHQLKSAIDEILKLNPKPGNSLSETTKINHYIIPDFVISNSESELELTLNSRNAPELRLNRTYKEMLQSYSANHSKKDKDAFQFVKQKVDSAKWFIDAIKQRQHTLYITMKAIMDYQYAYFFSGDERDLRPMILKDIADHVSLDISTISRVANSKYVQSPFGTILLKSLFSESLKTDSGEDVSTIEVKKILSNCIEAENKTKPVTDEQLTEILKEKGYVIARRTVAKYREHLNIPVARLRKELA